MKYGVNLLLFGDNVDKTIVRRFGHIKDTGFDGVEVPIFDPGSVDVDLIRKYLEKNELKVTISGALPVGTNFYGSSSKRAAAAGYIKNVIRVAGELGAKIIAGPLYKAVGDMDQSVPLAVQWRETIREMKPLLEFAEAKKIVLAFEPVNRFETNFMNTIGQGIDFCKKLDSQSAVLLLDTFHMHIEEKGMGSAIKKAEREGIFAHFHASENDRGIAGSGQVHWESVQRAIRKTSYDRWCVLESFSQDNQAIKTAVSCWRPFYPSTEKFLKEGLKFVKKLLSE